ncbi:MAG: thioredoxin family protein [Candidatus Hodarchaeales archaeon]
MVQVINDSEFAERIKENVASNSSRPLVVDCFTDWCPPCKASAPIYEQLSRKYGDKADFVKINVDHNQVVASKLRVQGVPTFAIIVGNKVKARIVGANMRKLENEIRKVLDL